MTHPSTGKRCDYFEAFEYDTQRQVQMVSMIFRNLDELSDMTSSPLSQRQFFPQELAALLHYNGFALESVWGGFDRSAPSAASESQIIVAKLRA